MLGRFRCYFNLLAVFPVCRSLKMLLVFHPLLNRVVVSLWFIVSLFMYVKVYISVKVLLKCITVNTPHLSSPISFTGEIYTLRLHSGLTELYCNDKVEWISSHFHYYSILVLCIAHIKHLLLFFLLKCNIQWSHILVFSLQMHFNIFLLKAAPTDLLTGHLF